MALLLTESDVAETLTMGACMEALEQALRRQDAGGVINHPRRRLRVPRGLFHFMEAADLGLGRAAMKAYSSFGGGAQFLVLLWETESGALLAVIEGDRLGRIRTGAASGVATRHMARPDAHVLAVFGAGGQAETQALAIAAVRPITRVNVYSRTPDKREALAERLAVQLGTEAVAVTAPAAALDGAEVVATAATSRTPVFDGALLRPGMHVNAMGSNSLLRAEIGADAVGRADRVVVDSIEQARAESGDLLGPTQMGRLRWEQVHELQEVVAGRWAGRASAEEITLFESHGLAIWDLAAASLVYDRARQVGAGKELSLWG